MKKQQYSSLFILLTLLLLSGSAKASADRTGLFLGTFDPPHHGIFRMIETSINRLGLKTIYVMPTPEPVGRTEVTPVGHRLAMLQLMTQSFSELTIPGEADLIAIASRKPDNLFAALREDIRDRHPNAEIYQIVGEDALPKLIARKQLPDENENRKIVVFPRHGVATTQHPGLTRLEKSGRLIRLAIDIPELSGQELRQSYAFGLEPSDIQLPQNIRNYIRREGLYGLSPATLNREIINRFAPGPDYRAQPVLLHSPTTDTSFVPAHIESFEMETADSNEYLPDDIPPALQSLIEKHIMQITIFQSPTTDALDWLETNGWRTFHGFVPATDKNVPMLFFTRKGNDWHLFITGIFTQNRFLKLISDMRTLFLQAAIPLERLTVLVPVQP